MDGKKLGALGAAVMIVAGVWFAGRGKGGAADGAGEAAEGAEGGKGGKRGKRAKGASGEPGGEREGAEAPEEADASRTFVNDFGTAAGMAREAKAALENATYALAEYQKYARWPESARPADEMAPGGGLLPHYAAPTSSQMFKRRPDGKPDLETPPSKSRIIHAMDRFHLGPDDSVKIILHALSEKDAELPMRCSAATVSAGDPISAPPPGPMPPMQVACQPHPGDKGMFVTFTPKQSAFRAFHGSIRFEFDLEVDRDDGTKESGMTRLHVTYNPAAGGRLTGSVREAYENGSIAYYLGYEAVGPGFARLNVRADNGADDGLFAHMNIRQEVDKAGPMELRAELFGKLIVDNNVTKVRLRDIDGEFIGRESGLSAPVPGKDGAFYGPKPIDRSKIKADEWQAPEKDLKMRDLEQSVKEAQENCDKNFDGCKE
jgi:hypothetical protein